MMGADLCKHLRESRGGEDPPPGHPDDLRARIAAAAFASAASAQQSESGGGIAHLPHDLSPWGMFMAADRVVKAVMIGLAVASLVTWTVWLAKTLELIVAKRRLRVALRRISAARLPGSGGLRPAGGVARAWRAHARDGRRARCAARRAPRRGRRQGAGRLAADAHRGGSRARA